MAGKTRNYTETFKEQIVALKKGGKRTCDIVNEYGITKSTVTKWFKDYTQTGSFKAKDNRSPEENEIIELRKKLALSEMENDILKQAALIMARK